ncbi:MAG: hypothetical protein JXR91_06470 [Deltaproteobacteria bacterium]|nr:hypothetical protein [Deltaproteobacteria bacterium]
MRLQFIFKVLIMIFATSFTSAALADDEDAQAKELFEKATTVFNNGQYANAAALFRQANNVKPTWKLQYNIGQAESAAKRYGLALEAFELYLADGGDDIPPERNEEVLKEVRRLRSMVASVNVEAPGGTEVFVNGVLRATTPLEGVIKVTAGKRHEVKLLQDGTVLAIRTVRLSGGDSTTVSATEEPVESSTTPAPEAVSNDDGMTADKKEAGESKVAPANNKGGKMMLIGTVLLTTGGLAAIGGGIIGGLSIGKAGELKDLCGDDKNCVNDEAVNLADSAWTLGVTSNVLISAGVAIGVTGIILMVLGSKKKKEQLADLRVVPVMSPGLNGFVLEGRF